MNNNTNANSAQGDTNGLGMDLLELYNLGAISWRELQWLRDLELTARHRREDEDPQRAYALGLTPRMYAQVYDA